jgi:hypothetical protein
VEPDQILRAGSNDRQLLAESLLSYHFADIHRLALTILRDDDEYGMAFAPMVEAGPPFFEYPLSPAEA